MPKSDLVKKIKDYFNLNIYETKAWLALVSKGIASAREIAEISGIPRSRTYDVLESLENKGFAILKVGKPVKFIAVKPTTVVEKMKNEAQKTAEERISFFDKLKDTKEYAELKSLHNSSLNAVKNEKVSIALKGKQNIYNYARDMIKEAEKEVLICIPSAEIIEKIRIFNFLFKNIKKGVKVNLHLNGSEEEVKKIKEKYSIDAKKTDVNLKFFSVDKKQILFSLNNTNPSEEELGIWVESEFFVNAMTKFFEFAK
jgi:HTH-type transcriptional regulator, sugar sensing transcriptional regulator